MRDLKTHIWVSALLRMVMAAGAGAYVVKKGDPDAGIVLLKVSTLDGLASVYMPERDFHGHRVWRARKQIEEKEADNLIQKRRGDDSDVWVVEIEDKEGRHFLVEPVV